MEHELLRRIVEGREAGLNSEPGMDAGTRMLYLQAALEAEEDFLEGRVHSQEEVEAWVRGKIGE